jgi:hypothetical protein
MQESVQSLDWMPGENLGGSYWVILTLNENL